MSIWLPFGAFSSRERCSALRSSGGYTHGWEVIAVKFSTPLCTTLFPWSLSAAVGVLGNGDI